MSTFADYLRAAIGQGITANGVFGAKVMFGDLPDLLGKLATLPGSRGLDDRALLERAFPNLRFVWIWREDVVAQAVSGSRAIQTGVWYEADARRSPATQPRFDFAQIHGLQRRIGSAGSAGSRRTGSSRSAFATKSWLPTWEAPRGGRWPSLGSRCPRTARSWP